MKFKLLLFVLTIGLTSCSIGEKIVLKLEEKKKEVTLFGEGLVSTSLYERDIAITPDGNELIYTLGNYKQTQRGLVSIKKINGHWGTPKLLTISGEYQDIEPFFTKDGNRLFFASNRPLKNRKDKKDYNIWYSDRNENGWGTPIALSDEINTEGDEFYPSISTNGNLYFTATKKDGIGREDIWVAKWSNGKYQKPTVLDTMINTKYYEFNAYVNPEENLLIFSSYGRIDDIGGGDLYYSKKDASGNWLPAKNMGKAINSKKLDYCPFIDYQRNMFYFTSERMKATTKVNAIETLIHTANSAQNGMGDLYRISLDQLLLD